jgi:hypothetical protein
MITIHSFKEMADLNQSGIVPFRIVQEIASVLLGLCGYEGDIPEAIAVTQQEVESLLTLSEEIDFMHYMGGNVHVCETEKDLEQVTGMDIEFGKQHGRWPNVTEAVLGWDECKYLLNADGSAEYALLFLAVCNSGGPSFILGRHLWQAAQIDKQIEAHQQFWSVAK